MHCIEFTSLGGDIGSNQGGFRWYYAEVSRVPERHAALSPTLSASTEPQTKAESDDITLGLYEHRGHTAWSSTLSAVKGEQIESKVDGITSILIFEICSLSALLSTAL
jgi:hypothetical protein